MNSTVQLYKGDKVGLIACSDGIQPDIYIDYVQM
ncbi:hypothetical protein J2Z69_001986 [Paenibacillus shirakamiensis]|uniref:Uncharacterized protein n=1 Tax=Paenibacillus shirakamiensis TaxID=1265935 RepID=A0ABS4JGU2_9BACL|nr:hypothetical protein [Paenibacillus shirakamiensis]